MNKKGFIFDFDGTIVDTLPSVLACLNEMKREDGGDFLSRNNLLPVISKGGREIISTAFNTLDPQKIDVLLSRFRAKYRTQQSDEDSLYPGVVNALESLRTARKKLYLCTNKPASILSIYLEKFKLNQYFDIITSGDDFAFKKPNPIILRDIFLDSKCTKEDFLIIGDSSVDYALARNSGISFILHLGGYNDINIPLDKISKFCSYRDFESALFKGNL